MSYQPKSYRKFLATSLAAAMVATVAAPIASTTVAAAGFSDVVATAYYADAVNKMAEAGFINGVGNGQFGTGQDLLRRDAAVLFSRVLLWDTTDAGATGFTDVAVGQYYTDAIAVAVENGVINGKTATSFAPTDKLTRGEMAVLLTRALNLTVDPTVVVPLNDIAGHAYEDQIKAVYQAGLTTGYADGSYKAGATVTRAEFATFLYRDATVKENVAKEIKGLDVKEVKVVNQTTVEVTLDEAEADLKVADFKVTGATVSAVKADDKNEVYTLTVATLDGKKGSVAVNGVSASYDYEEIIVISVEATTKVVDTETSAQFLQLTINNGRTVTISELEDAGYKVEFQTTQDVLDNGSGTAANVNASGRLLNSTLAGVTDEKFKYSIELKKDNDVFVSKQEEVSVVTTVAGKITSAKVLLDFGAGDEVELKSNTLSLKDTTPTIQIGKIKADLINGSKNREINASDASYKSSNEEILIVDKDGVIQLVSTGNATVTITSGGAKYDLNIKVVADERKVTKAVPTVNNQKLVRNGAGNKDVAFTVTDQYGDPVFNESLIDTEIFAAGKKIADVDFTGTTTKKGEITATITTADEVGKGTVTIKHNDGSKDLNVGSLSVETGNSGETSTNKVELKDPTKSFTIDLNPDNDTTVVLVIAKYTSQGFFKGYNTDVEGTSAAVDIATATDNDAGEITVTAVKKGTVTISLKEGSETLATQRITVEDTKPKITGVTFENLFINNETTDIATKVLKPLKIAIEGSAGKNVVRYEEDDAGKFLIYLDEDDNGSFDSDSDDIRLGYVTAVSTKTVSITGGDLVVDNNETGTVIVRVTSVDGKTVYGTKSFNFDTK